MKQYECGLNQGHNPCFSGILFAIFEEESSDEEGDCHNPCFSGILFAIIFGVINIIR